MLDLGASVVAHAWTPYDVSAWNASPTEADAVFEELKELGPVKQIQADFAQPESPAAVMLLPKPPSATSTSSLSTIREAEAGS